MKAYVATTGVLFGLLVVAHICRLFVEPEQWRDPWFGIFTVLGAIMAFWSWRVLRTRQRA